MKGTVKKIEIMSCSTTGNSIELMNLQFTSKLAYKLTKMFILIWPPFSYYSGSQSFSIGGPFPDTKVARV